MKGPEGRSWEGTGPSSNDVEAERLFVRSIKGSRLEMLHGHSGDLAEFHLKNEKVLGLVRSLESHHTESAYHSIRAAEIALDMGQEMGLNDARQKRILVMAALLHDIGKRDTPLEILNKSGPLTPEEKQIMDGHVRDGVNILQSPEARDLENIDEIVRVVSRHHEYKREGTYPRDGEAAHPGRPEEQRKDIGPDLERLARILVAAETFDALLTKRSYRQGQPPLLKEEIRAIMKKDLKEEVADATDVAVERYARPEPK